MEWTQRQPDEEACYGLQQVITLIMQFVNEMAKITVTAAGDIVC